MILQSNLEELYPNVTFGQIQDSPDDLINMNIIDTGRRPFFQDNDCNILSLGLFVRGGTYEVLQMKMCEITKNIINLYKDIPEIILVKQTNAEEPFRDNKNRYYQQKTFELLVNKTGG